MRMTYNPNFFDVFSFVENIEKAGAKKELAEALAKEMIKYQQTSVDNLATKRDLEESKKSIDQEVKSSEIKLEQKIDVLSSRMDSKFEALEHNMNHKFDLIRTEMEVLRKDIVIKLGGLMAVGISIIAVLIKF
jgi:hypothetical protein